MRGMLRRRVENGTGLKCAESTAHRRAEFAACRASTAKNVTGLKCAELCRVYRIPQVVGPQVYRVCSIPCKRRWWGNRRTSGLPATTLTVSECAG